MNLSSYNNSGTVNITVDDNGIQANTAPVIEADMLAYNGVVHSLGEVMPFDFPAPEGVARTITMTCGNGVQVAGMGRPYVLVDGNEGLGNHAQHRQRFVLHSRGHWRPH